MDIITSARERRKKAKEYALEARQLATKVKEESAIQAAEEDKEKSKLDAKKAEEVAKKAMEAERKAAGIVAQEKVLNAEPNTLATVQKVLQRVASFILNMINSKNKELTLDAPKMNTPEENETLQKEEADKLPKEETDKSNQRFDKIEVEGNDQDVLSYLYN